ncbi:hypothetical protein ACIGXI_01170 [Kitasatospora aureofaciens]|uniref:hypothetical protein n=1 Tax=Kitasatospora aureofaciens TaxID=1894 RepID=UPI0037CAB4A3
MPSIPLIQLAFRSDLFDIAVEQALGDPFVLLGGAFSWSALTGRGGGTTTR